MKMISIPMKTKIPCDLDGCFVIMKKNINKEDLEMIENMSEDELSKLHLGLGMFLRNKWKLWEGSKLSKYFNSLGIDHPDDMSGIVITSFWRHLNNKPIELDEQISYYKKYWENIHIRLNYGTI